MSPSDPPASHDPILAARDEVASARVVPALQADPNGPGEQPGDHIGRYKLLQRIGEGGFGVVWMAEQTEPVRRKVALKVIKLGMDTRQVIARFEAERQALALMDHPHIAKVLDGGATEQGRPFFVMELVKGVPITEFCDRAKLGLRQRLDLFVKVCGAVQHAHTKGVIHRDLKPGNVLVTLHDGEAVPKVIDFGIAKATSAELTQKTLFTEFRQMIGTPEYMAPEQAELSGLDVDTRADVYSLGVLLYELLTGTKPFDLRTVMERGYQELIRAICEQDPPPPSTRVSTLGQQGGEIALSRGAEPGRLGVVLRGDLDWIVMRALEKDRTRRYETVNGLAADVRRYLDDEPVLATPPSAAYRLRKLVRRNKGLFVGAAAVLAVLLLGIAGTTAGLIASMRAEDRARAEAVLARTAQASEARQREEAVAQRAVAEEQSRRAQLATEAEASQRELAEAETVRALAAERVASARFDSARGLARAMMDEVGGRLHNVPGTLPARRALLESVLTYLDELSVDASDDEALQVEVADAYMRLGVLLGNPFSGEAIGDFDGALEANQRALELRQALAAAHPDERGYRAAEIRAQDAVASSLSVLGRDAESLELNLAALAAARELAEVAPVNRELARFMQGRLGNTYAGLERYTDALDQFFPLHEDLVDLRVNPDVDPPDLVHTVKVSYHQMARCWQGLGELDLAFEDSAQTLRFARALHVRYPDDARYLRDVAGRLRYHGLLLLELGRLDEALDNFAESEQLGRGLYERDPANALAARFLLANLLDLGEAYADAAERSPVDSEQRRELRARAAGLLQEGLDHLADLSRGDMRTVLETQVPAEEREELRRMLAELRG